MPLKRSELLDALNRDVEALKRYLPREACGAVEIIAALLRDFDGRLGAIERRLEPHIM